jgi:plastocyanin
VPTATKTVAVTPEITPTGTKIRVKIDRDRGYYVLAQKNLIIKPGDEVIWENAGTYPLTLISKDGLFEDKLLDYWQITNYTFKKTGTFSFDIKVRNVIKFNGTVSV